MRIVLIIPESSKSERDCLGRRKELGLGMLIIDPEYLQWIKELSLRYRRGQIKAAVKVNQEMLRYYWDLGKDIVQRDAENKYGSGFFNVLSRDLKASLGLSKGFSPTTLKYAKYFYCLYSQALENRQQVADDLVAVFFASTVILNVVYQANAHKCQDHSNYAFHNTSFF